MIHKDCAEEAARICEEYGDTKAGQGKFGLAEGADDCATAIRAAVSPEPPRSPAENLEAMVASFLSWPLPESVRSDDCATIRGQPHRSGTNLLTADEARKMLQYVLAAASPEPVREGTVSVPVEPTDEIIRVLSNALLAERGTDGEQPEAPHGEYPLWYGSGAKAAEIYKAMLAAAQEGKK